MDGWDTLPEQVKLVSHNMCKYKPEIKMSSVLQYMKLLEVENEELKRQLDQYKSQSSEFTVVH